MDLFGRGHQVETLVVITLDNCRTGRALRIQEVYVATPVRCKSFYHTACASIRGRVIGSHLCEEIASEMPICTLEGWELDRGHGRILIQEHARIGLNLMMAYGLCLHQVNF